MNIKFKLAIVLVLSNIINISSADTIITDQGEWSQPKAPDIEQRYTLNVSVGGYPGATSSKDKAGVINGFIISVMEIDCGDLCFKPFMVSVSSDVASRNFGLGGDAVYKLVNTKRHTFEISAGAVVFNGRLNGDGGEYANIHIGAQFKIMTGKKSALTFGYDHFSNGRKAFNRDNVTDNIPIDMLSAGYQW